jgi:hypothetical protein
MRDVAHVNKAERLQDATENQEPSEEYYDCDRRYDWKDQRQDPAQYHQNAL